LDEGSERFNTFLISESDEIVLARGGYKVVADFNFMNHPEIDVLVIVGGVHIAEMDKTEVIEWIASSSKKAKITASVCTGAFLLAKAKVIETNTVTTHWEDIPDLKTMFPTLKVVGNVRWVDEGNLVTSGGISAGIDMSLHLVSKLKGIDLAEKTAKQMEFSWTKNT